MINASSLRINIISLIITLLIFNAFEFAKETINFEIPKRSIVIENSNITNKEEPKEEKNIEEFRRRLNVNCTLTDEELRPKIVIDVPMPVSYITKELVEQISLLEPFGKGNTKPVFAQKNLRVLDHSIIGKNKNVVKLKLLDPQGISVEGIYFGEAEDFVNFIREKDSISVTYYPEINRFRGRESLQIIIQNYC